VGVALDTSKVYRLLSLSLASGDRYNIETTQLGETLSAFGIESQLSLIQAAKGIKRPLTSSKTSSDGGI
jgi:hypothetical protein